MSRAILGDRRGISGDKPSNTAFLLVLGSHEQGGEIERLADRFRRQLSGETLEIAYLPPGSPSIQEGIRAAVRKQAGRIIVLPGFVSLGQEAREAIRLAMEASALAHPGVCFTVGDPLGRDVRLTEILVDLGRAAQSGGESPSSPFLILVDGLVRFPRRLTFEDMAGALGQVEDVETLVPGRRGSGLRVGCLLAAVEPTSSAEQVTFHAAEEGFNATVSLAQASGEAILVYRLGDGPLPERMGGPVRLIIPGGEDGCHNVKRVVRMEVR